METSHVEGVVCGRGSQFEGRERERRRKNVCTRKGREFPGENHNGVAYDCPQNLELALVFH